MKRQLTKSELQDALRAKSVAFNASLGLAKLQELARNNNIETEVEVEETEVETAETIEKVSFNGTELEPKKADNQKIRDFVATKRAKEFPNFIGNIPADDEFFYTTGLCDLYNWTSADGDDVVLPLVFLKGNKTDKLFPVGTWDIMSRTMHIKLQNGSIVNPRWINNQRYTSSSERDRIAFNTEPGIKVVLRSGVGHWEPSRQERPRDFNISWLELAD